MQYSNKDRNNLNECDEIVTLSPFVTQLASMIYSQLDGLIKAYGAGPFSVFMQSIVETLEQLEKFYKRTSFLEEENQKLNLENESVANNIENIKSLKIQAEERLFELTDTFERDKNELEKKIKLAFNEIKELNYRIKLVYDQNDSLEKVISNHKIAYKDLQDRYRDMLMSLNNRDNDITEMNNINAKSISESNTGMNIKNTIKLVDKCIETIDLELNSTKDDINTNKTSTNICEMCQNGGDSRRNFIEITTTTFSTTNDSQSLANELASLSNSLNHDEKSPFQNFEYITHVVELNSEQNQVCLTTNENNPTTFENNENQCIKDELKLNIIQSSSHEVDETTTDPLNNLTDCSSVVQKDITQSIDSMCQELVDVNLSCNKDKNQDAVDVMNELPTSTDMKSKDSLIELTFSSKVISPITIETSSTMSNKSINIVAEPVILNESGSLSDRKPSLTKKRILPNPFDSNASNNCIPTEQKIKDKLLDNRSILSPFCSSPNLLDNSYSDEDNVTSLSLRSTPLPQIPSMNIISKTSIQTQDNDNDFDAYFSNKASPRTVNQTGNRSEISTPVGNDTNKNIKPNIPQNILKFIQQSNSENTDLRKDLQNLLYVIEDLILSRDQTIDENSVLKSKIESINYELIVSHENLKRTDNEFNQFRMNLLDIEQELRRLKQENETLKSNQDRKTPNELIPRTELHRIIQERNNYKKRLEDLQEAVQLAEMIRISKDNQSSKKKSFLNRVFGGLLKPKPFENEQEIIPISRPSAIINSWQSNIKQQRYEHSIIHDESKDRMSIFGWSVPTIMNISSSILPMPIFFRILNSDNFNSRKQNNKIQLWCGDICIPNDPINYYNISFDVSNELTAWLGYSRFVSVINPVYPDSPIDWIDIDSGFVLSICSVPGITPLIMYNLTLTHEEMTSFGLKKPINTHFNDGDSWEVLKDRPESIYQTIWVGCESGRIVIFSSHLASRCFLGSVKLSDPIIGICYSNDSVFVAQSSGVIIKFSRNNAGRWDLINRKQIEVGKPNNCVRSIVSIGNTGKIWVSHRNKIYIIDATAFRTIHCFEVVEDALQQIRSIQLSPDSRLAFITLRLDCNIVIYDTQTCKLVLIIDLDAQIHEAFGATKSDLATVGESRQKLVRITSLLPTSNYLWVGTSLGNVVTIPVTTTQLSNSRTDKLYLPVTNNSQHSFHGHGESVKFFLSFNAPSLDRNNKNGTSTDSYVLSGGTGYMDFRIGNDHSGETNINSKTQNSMNETNYLIVWQLGGTVQ